MTCAPDSPAGPSDAASPYGPAAPAPGARPARPVRVHHLTRAKERGERLTMLTAYDAVTARILDEAGTDMLLVGDSIGNVMLGHDTTLPATLQYLNTLIFQHLNTSTPQHSFNPTFLKYVFCTSNIPVSISHILS